jgi:small subunit ribosomal protein S13
MGSTKVRVKDEGEGKLKEKKAEKKPEAPKKREMRVIVRVIDTNLDGDRPLRTALTGIKGIGHAMSNAICEIGGFDPSSKLGSLNETELTKLEGIIKDPKKFGLPSWSLNRRKEPDSGADLHLTGDDLDVARKFDIQKFVDLKTYRGMRHMLGQPVRGQRTRSSFRGGRIVGVVKKSIKIAMEKAKTEEKKKE